MSKLCPSAQSKLDGCSLILSDIVAGMDATEMDENFDGAGEDEDYHPFKNGGLISLG